MELFFIEKKILSGCIPSRFKGELFHTVSGQYLKELNLI